MPENGAMALPIDGNESDLAGFAGFDLQVFAVHLLIQQASANPPAGIVIADRSGHRHRDPQASQGDQGSRHRAAALDQQGMQLGLLVAVGVFIQPTEVIERALAETEDLAFSAAVHGADENGDRISLPPC